MAAAEGWFVELWEKHKNIPIFEWFGKNANDKFSEVAQTVIVGSLFNI